MSNSHLKRLKYTPNFLKDEMSRLEEVADQIRNCKKCPLHLTRKNAVPGEGPEGAYIFFVGEAPGKEEDLQGRPFVGAAGEILNTILRDVGIKREEVFITSILKCRPPGNRPPRKEEMEKCRPYLFEQIESVNPKFIVPLGNYGLQSLLGSRVSISEARGKKLKFRNWHVLPTFHPAAVLYNPLLKEKVLLDLRKISRSA